MASSPQLLQGWGSTSKTLSFDAFPPLSAANSSQTPSGRTSAAICQAQSKRVSGQHVRQHPTTVRILNTCCVVFLGPVLNTHHRAKHGVLLEARDYQGHCSADGDLSP